MIRSRRLWLVVLGSVLLTVLLWLSAKTDVIFITLHPLRSASQVLALVGVVLLSMTLTLSTRLGWLEDWLGGLDKVFRVHHWLGAMGFLLILNHPLLLALEALPSIADARSYLFWGPSLPYNLGISGVYLMLIGFCCMLFIKLPYHWWLRTHRLLGWGLLLGGVHALLIGSDIGSSWPLKVWMLGWIGLAAEATLYSLLWQKIWPARKWFTVAGTQQRGSVLIITLQPIRPKPLLFVPGQFVQVSFNNPALSRESHPFSIASAPMNPLLTLAIKMQGDYTAKLPAVCAGDLAAVAGPFGRFAQLNERGEVVKKVAVAGKRATNTSPQQKSIWMAAGIGVTPFLSLLRQEVDRPQYDHVWFYYCYRDTTDGVFCQDIEELLPKVPHIHFLPWPSSQRGRLTMAEVATEVTLTSVESILLCGPASFMQSLAAQAQTLGVVSPRVQYEEFSFLS